MKLSPDVAGAGRRKNIAEVWSLTLAALSLTSRFPFVVKSTIYNNYVNIAPTRWAGGTGAVVCSNLDVPYTSLSPLGA